MAAHSTVAGGRRLRYWKLTSLLLAGAALAACRVSVCYLTLAIRPAALTLTIPYHR